MPTLVGACCVPSLILAVAEYESCCRTHFLEPESLRGTSHGRVIVKSVAIGDGTRKSGWIFNFPYLAYLESIGCNSWPFPYCRPQNALLAAQTESGVRCQQQVPETSSEMSQIRHRSTHIADTMPPLGDWKTPICTVYPRWRR